MNNPINVKNNGVQLWDVNEYKAVNLPKGYILTFDDNLNAYVGLPPGTDNQALATKSTEDTGLDWVDFTAANGGAFELLACYDPDDVIFFDIVNPFDSSFNTFLITYDVFMDEFSNLGIQVSSDGGSTFFDDLEDYQSRTFLFDRDTTTSRLRITLGVFATEQPARLFGTVLIANVNNDSRKTHCITQFSQRDSQKTGDPLMPGFGGSLTLTTDVINAIRFMQPADPFSGRICIYGVNE